MLLASCYLAEDFYDLIDLDSFGSDTVHLATAIDAVKYGGLLYLTSTDGFSSGGLNPTRSLAAYGAYLRSLPFSNEQGLRMLIGAAVKEAAAKGVCLQPVFSLYSYHGPVFRVMLRASRSHSWPVQHYNFLGHCHVHEQTRVVPWRQLSDARCRCTSAGGSGGSDRGADGSARGTPLVLSGPMWTGPLHNVEDLLEMRQEAERRGWQGHGVDTGSAAFHRKNKKNSLKPLEAMLDLLIGEADPRLPPAFLPISSIAKFLDTTPSRDKLIAALQQAGFAAARTHVESRALLTNATMQQVLQVACDGLGHRRSDSHGSSVAVA